MMSQMIDETIKFQNAVMGVKQIAHDMQDYMIEVEIDKILIDVNEQVAQMILIHGWHEQSVHSHSFYITILFFYHISHLVI